MSTFAAQCARALPAQAEMAATGAPYRRSATFGSVLAVDQGVGTAWSVQAHDWSGRATAADRAAALAWCAGCDGGQGFLVTVPDDTTAARWAPHGLAVADRLPVLAMAGAAAGRLDPVVPAELEFGPPRTRAELVAAYGGWMDDEPLAAALVTADDLVRPGRAFLVGRVAGRVVGCALVWFAAGTAYLSGIGVVGAQRGRGYGRSLTMAAARLAAAGPRGGVPPGVVWMTASPEGLPVYRRLGFEPAGEEVRLRAG